MGYFTDWGHGAKKMGVTKKGAGNHREGGILKPGRPHSNSNIIIARLRLKVNE
jgi:hypothetical protein